MRKVLLAIVAVFITGLIIPSTVQAIDYTIDDMIIQVELKPNGVIHVYETQTYSFDSSFNGITRTLYPKAGSYINNFAAVEMHDELEVELEGNTYYIHRKGEAGEKVTITTFYIIYDGLEVYEDVAQFYWPFFDKRNETDYENMEIIIYPPEPTEVIDVIGYDTAENTEEIFDDGIVHFSLGKVKSEKNGDIRLLYDSSLFSSSLAEEKKLKSYLMEEIDKEREKRAKTIERMGRLEKVSPTILTIIGGVLAVLLMTAWIKRRLTIHDVERSYTPAHFIPKERVSLPAMIFFMKRTKLAFSQLLNVAFLDLVRRGLVKQVDEKTFTVTSRNTPYEHEVFLIDWLFGSVGKNDTLHIDQLEEYVESEEEAIDFQQDFKKWSDYINLEISKNELREVVSLPRILAIVIETFLFIFIIIYALHNMFGYLAIVLVYNVITVFFIAFYQPRTVKGIMIKRDWDNFVKKYIDEPEKYLNALTEEERDRAYLYSFAIENKEINEVNDYLAKGLVLRNVNALDPAYFLIFTKEAEKYFQAAYQTSYVHYSTSTASGGGGGGVGGGGGGSGAF